MKIYSHTETCTQMCTAALLVVAEARNQPRCPPTCTWLNCGTYITWNTAPQWKGTDYCDGCNNLDESPGIYAEWKQPIPKGYMVHNSIYITFLKWWNFGNGEQISGCQRWEIGELAREVVIMIKGQQHKRSFWCWDCSVSRLWWSQTYTAGKIIWNLIQKCACTYRNTHKWAQVELGKSQ